MFAAMLKDTNEADRLKRSAEQRDRMQEIIDNIEAKSEGTRAEHTAGIETVAPQLLRSVIFFNTACWDWGDREFLPTARRPGRTDQGGHRHN